MSCDTIDDGQILATASRSYVVGYPAVDSNNPADPWGSDDDTFPVLIPQVSEPNSRNMRGLVALGDNFAELAFLLDDNDAAAQALVTRWDRVLSPDGKTVLWIPVPVVLLDLVAGSAVGVAGSWVPATAHFCDTVAVATSGTYDPGIEVQTDVRANGIGTIRIDPKGSKYLHVGFELGEGADLANFLIKTY